MEHDTPTTSPTSPSSATSELLAAVAAFSGTRFRSSAEASQVALGTIARMIGVRSAFVSRLDSQMMTLLDVWEDAGCGFEAGAAVPLEDTFCQLVRATSEPMIVEDAANDVRVQNLATRSQFGIGCYLGVPITLDNGEVFGTLCLLDPQPRRFSADQVAALSIMASQIGGLIEREATRNAVRRVEHEAMHDLTATLESLENQSLLVRAIVHDLRAPLTSVRGYTDLLRQGLYGELGADQQNALGSMHHATALMTRLVTDLLDAAAVETQTISLLNTPYDAGAVVLRVIDLCATQAQQYGCELVAEVSSALAPAVGDPMRVEQVLLNLIQNALSHSASGLVTLGVAQQADRLIYTVSDTGSGIPGEQQAQIWEKYRRYGAGPGLGLGLYIVRRLTEAMDGTITLASDPATGTQFTVSLPLQGDRPQRVALA